MTRTNLLNQLVKHFGYSNYLEIGVADSNNFLSVEAQVKVGVDPDPRVRTTYRMTSDVFFRQNRMKFDLIFIDGLHERDQVDRDINNALEALRENGTIVLHDCNPTSEIMQIVPRERGCTTWTGDVWKSLVRLRTERSDLSVCVVDIDWGCGIVRHGSQTQLPNTQNEPMTYSYLDKHRVKLLNLISYSTWIAGMLHYQTRLRMVRLRSSRS
jgi:hypothetical protein